VRSNKGFERPGGHTACADRYVCGGHCRTDRDLRLPESAVGSRGTTESQNLNIVSRNPNLRKPRESCFAYPAEYGAESGRSVRLPSAQRNNRYLHEVCPGVTFECGKPADAARAAIPAGVRTLPSSTLDRYNPVGYQMGTVWPHDNSIIPGSSWFAGARYGWP
jgi:hypothetical protein